MEKLGREAKRDKGGVAARNTGHEISSESWLVVVSQEVKTLTLDELAVAFERGDVDAQTAVWTAGMATWEPLGVVAHLEDGLPLESKPNPYAPSDEMLGSHPQAGTPADPNVALWASIAPVPNVAPITRVRRRVSAWSALLARVLRARQPHVKSWLAPLRLPRVWSWVPIIAGGAALGVLVGWSAASAWMEPTALVREGTSEVSPVLAPEWTVVVTSALEASPALAEPAAAPASAPTVAGAPSDAARMLKRHADHVTRRAAPPAALRKPGSASTRKASSRRAEARATKVRIAPTSHAKSKPRGPSDNK